MQCYICNSEQSEAVPGKVRDRPETKIFRCKSCDLVYLDPENRPDDSFYAESGMHAEEISVDEWLREAAKDDQRRADFILGFGDGKDLLDFGSGAGGFLMQVKNRMNFVCAVEPEKRLKQHYAAQEIAVYDSVAAIPEDRKFDTICLFHVLEHLPDPRPILAELRGRLKPGGKIYVEVPSANDALIQLYGNRAFSEFTYWSCHMYLFNPDNLDVLARQSGLKTVITKQVQRYPLSNHLHWMAKEKPGGHQVWSFLDSPELNRAYENRLAGLGLCDTILTCLEAE